MTGPSADHRRILAMGGGGFTMQELSPALDRLVLTLTGKPAPRICFMPTASGDPREQATRFQERFGAWPCEPSILSLFHLARDRMDPREHLLAQDAIYVGGGSMLNMLAVWREHGVDGAMRTAWDAGTVLAGVSAGAMCWFRGGVTMSGGAPAPLAGLGLLPGSMSVHMNSEPDRLPVYRAAVSSGQLESGYAVDDAAGLVFAGPRLVSCVASRPDARVVQVVRDLTGGLREYPMQIELLPGASARGRAGSDSFAVSELRELRAGRRRWD